MESKGNDNRWKKRRALLERMDSIRKRRRTSDETSSDSIRRPSTLEESDPCPAVNTESNTPVVANPSLSDDDSDATIVAGNEDDAENDDDAENSDDDDDDDDDYCAVLQDKDIYSIAQEWIREPERGREVRQMVSALFYGHLRTSGKKTVKGAAKAVGKMIGVGEKSVRVWMTDLKSNGGKFPTYGRGKYRRVSIMHDDVRREATKWIRENTCVKGKGNMTIKDFQRYINDQLLPSLQLPDEFPKKVSETTAKRFLHDLGFSRRKTSQKSVYMDGHEREDVVKSRAEYVSNLQSLEKDHLVPPLPNDALPDVEQPGFLGNPLAEKHLVTIFHDETVFQSNEDQTLAWSQDDQFFIRKKGRGAGIVISDFIEEHDGFLRIPGKEARRQFEFGKNRDGFWTADHFLNQVEKAVAIAEEKYPRDQYTLLWIFDHSSNHASKGKDALVADRMNLSSGKKQPTMRDTVWNGRPFKMVFPDGKPKGLKVVLEERGVNCAGLKRAEMVAILEKHDDFANEKSLLERAIEGRGHICRFLPKYHCELNPIERVWCVAKRIAREKCRYNIVSLRQIISVVFDSISTDMIRKFFRKCREYVEAYAKGSSGWTVENAAKVYKSHRRILGEQL